MGTETSGKFTVVDAVRFVLKSTTEDIPTSPAFAIQPKTDFYTTDAFAGGTFEFTGEEVECQGARQFHCRHEHGIGEGAIIEGRATVDSPRYK